MENVLVVKVLKQLFQEHDGKLMDKWALYLDEYERLFAPYRERPVRLLEIGIQNGGSLEIWSQFFSHAEKLVGCDIDPACAELDYNDPRISVVVADANTDEAQQQITTYSPCFDLIIDDGSHVSKDIVCSFARYFPYLEYGGLYVVEDLHCGYWRTFGGGLFHPHSCITFFKQLADIVNYEHWGVDKPRSELLRSFEARYGTKFDEKTLSKIHSIEFVNSLCIVKKMNTCGNALGQRLIAGTSESVFPGIRLQSKNPCIPEDQRDNRYSSHDMELEEKLLLAQSELARQDKEIVYLEQKLISKDNEINCLQQTLVGRDNELSRVQKEIKTIYNSMSWRLTSPIRLLRSHVSSRLNFNL